MGGREKGAKKLRAMPIFVLYFIRPQSDRLSHSSVQMGRGDIMSAGLVSAILIRPSLGMRMLDGGQRMGILIT